MLYGVGIGLTKEHLTLEAIKVIKKVDEVIVPGKMAYEIIKDIREPRIVEFLMGKSEEVVKNLAMEIASRLNEEIAFCCIGDPVFYSTFHHLVDELRNIKPDAEIRIIPGISSISTAMALTETFVSNSAIISTPDFSETEVAVILKVKNPKDVEKKLREKGFKKFFLLEKMFMEGEAFYEEMPENSSYFSVLVARR
ncbi:MULTISPECIES: precorrin-2 C(20)-methyltransferase [unclassified Archaeoglobus]|uniref:precorrin-2 C(20)-methyltransferase n=1 Tax=unclassified Archaeoglobus TaxID=2643606 RepID=UPI0025C2B750|nr:MULTISPECIES: SAM-dependent methyltransferase [unclassified Archaeoglobus]